MATTSLRDWLLALPSISEEEVVWTLLPAMEELEIFDLEEDADALCGLLRLDAARRRRDVRVGDGAHLDDGVGGRGGGGLDDDGVNDGAVGGCGEPSWW